MPVGQVAAVADTGLDSVLGGDGTFLYGASLVADNRAGANGVVAGDIVAKAPVPPKVMQHVANTVLKMPPDILKDLKA